MARRKDHRDTREVSEVLIRLASRPMGVSATEAAAVLGIEDKAAGYYLSALSRDQRKLARVRGGKASRYCLPDRVLAVQLHIEEYEHEQALAAVVRTVPQGQWAHKPCKGQVSSVWDLAK
jgi:hypothetical protein